MAEPNDWQEITDWEDVGAPQQAQTAQAAAPTDWQDVTDWEPVEKTPQAESPLATGVREAAHAVIPATGAIPAIGAGFALGAAAGALTGPAAPIASPVLGLAGALAGGMGASHLISEGQEYLLDKLGFDDSSQRQVNRKENPKSAFVGELAPNALAFSPGKGLQLASRGLGAAGMGGIEAGQEWTQGEGFDPAKIAMAMATGAVFNTPTKRVGAPLLAAGERVAKPLTERMAQFKPGRPDQSPTPTMEQEKAEGGSSVPPSVAIGVSESRPPPSKQHETIGNPATADHGSERLYPKDNARPTEQSPGVTLGDLTPEQMVALSESTEKNALGVQHGTELPEIKPTDPTQVETGLQKPGKYELNMNDVEAPAPAPPAPAAEVKPPTPSEPPRVVDMKGIPKQGRKNPRKAAAPGEEAPGTVQSGLKEVAERMAPEPDVTGMIATPKEIDAAAKKTPVKLTKAQKETGEYSKGTAEVIPGVKVAIENARGTTREGVGPTGKKWKVKMPQHYGEIEGTRGADGDKVDAFIGKGKRHFVIDQQHIEGPKAGQFDEHKVMLNQKGPKEALETYIKAHDKNGIERVQNIKEMSADELKAWLKDRKATQQPVKQQQQQIQPPKKAVETKEQTAARDAAQREFENNTLREEAAARKERANVQKPAEAAAPAVAPQAASEITVAPRKPGSRAVRETISFGEEVTAPVTKPQPRPGSVQKAIDDARAAGMEALAKKIEDAGSAGDAVKVARQVRRKLGTVSQPAKVEGLGVTARSKADATVKSAALDATKKAFKDWAPESDAIPTTAAEKAELRNRLSGALNAAAEANGGKDPLKTYRPNVKPAEWLWLREAQRLLNSKSMTPKRIAEFIANEKQLRSGVAEDVENVRATKKVEGAIATQKRPTTEQAMEAGAGKTEEVSENWFEPVAEAEKPDVKALDPTGDHPVELKDMTQKELEGFKFDQQKVIMNLIADVDTPHKDYKGKRVLADETPTHEGRKIVEDLTEPAWKKAEAERLAKQEERAKELKALRERPAEGEELADPGRKVALTDEHVKAAMETLAKAEAKKASSKAPRVTAPVDEMFVPKKKKIADLADRFLKDEGGALNVDQINSDFKTKKVELSKAMTDWIRSTWGKPMTNREWVGESLLRKFGSVKDNMKAELGHLLEADWHVFTKIGRDSSYKFLHTLENIDAADTAAFRRDLEANGVTPQHSEWLADRAPIYRKLLDEAYRKERMFGSTAEYLSNYVPHIFKDMPKAMSWINEQLRQRNLGPTGFQKTRAFLLIAEAEKHGFKLKYDNPADLIMHRLLAGHDMEAKISLLKQWQEHGLAHKTVDLSDGMKRHTEDWPKVVAPDHAEYRLSPENWPIWKNAVDAKGLWAREDGIGTGFRGWMAFKSAWVPIKLMMSAFHLVHVVGNVNVAENIARGLKEEGFLNKLKAMPEALKYSVTDPLFYLPLEKLPKVGNYFRELGNKPFEGKWVRNALKQDSATLTPEQRLAKRIMEEAGMSGSQSEQWRVQGPKAFRKALAEGKYWKLLPAGASSAVKYMQGWMFEDLIPNLKAAQVMRSAAQLLRQRPDLITNHTDRGIALSAIGKSIDNRFGEMFYTNTFWNRTLKDASIGSFLSLGWNLGQVREAGGAIRNAQIALTDLTGYGPKPSAKQRVVYDASNKMGYVTSYVALSMLSAGALSYAMSGVLPTGLDYIYSRVGGNNPDGSPRRVSPPFNTREGPMLMKHIEEAGGGVSGTISGLMHVLYNKMILSPIVDAWNNKDFFGNQLFDPDAPWFMQALQLVDSTLGNTFNPIAVSGHQRAKQTGGGKADIALSYAGFGPAPAYISRSPIQNRIAHDYGKYVSATRPYEQSGTGLVQGLYRWATDDPRKAEARREGRAKLDRAMQSGDTEGAAQARKELIQGPAKMSPDIVKKLRPGESDLTMFARLPIEAQKKLVRDMSGTEWSKYMKTVGGKTRAELIKERGVNP